jgi:fructose-1-phosphate kinase PfkB-like protein
LGEGYGESIVSGFFLAKRNKKKRREIARFALIYGRFECHGKNIG